MADVIITGNVKTISDTGETLPAVAITSSVEEGVTLQGSLTAGGKGDKGDPGDPGESAAISIGGNTSGVTSLISTGTIQLYGGSNITLSQDAQTITIIGGAGGGGGVTPAISGSNGSFSFSTLTLGNLNGLSFYSSNNSIVGSYTVPTQTQFVLSNSNGVSFGTNGSTVTASVRTDYQSSGAYLTTARASNDAVGLNTALTGNGVAWTVNSSGLSLNVPAFLTTAMQSASSSVFAKTGFTSASTAGSDIAATLNTNGLSVGMPKYLTTAQPTGAYLTTARASNDGVGLNTAITNGTWTVNSSGISLNLSNHLTTAMASNRGTDFVQATAAFNGTNASGTIASNGISISVAAPGGGGALAASASNGSFTFSTLGFSNANNVTFGTSAGSIITASVAAPGAAAENNWVNLLGANTAGNTTVSGSTIGVSGINLTLSGTNGSAWNISAPATSSLSATGQVSISTNGSTISIGVPNQVYESRYNEFKESPMVVGQQGQATLHVQPWIIPNLHMDRVIIHVVFSNSSNSSGSGTFSNWVGIYTNNASTLSLLASASISNAVTMSGTAGSYSQFGGFRQRSIGLTQTLTEGMYWIGMINRSTTGGANMSYSQVLNSQINSNFSGEFGVASAATKALSLGFGVYTASTTALPNSIGFTQINGTASLALRPPSIYFVSGTI